MKILIALLAVTSLAIAQSTKAELFGVVHDPGALPVSGATVGLLNADTQVMQEVQSMRWEITTFRRSVPGTIS